MDRYRGVSANDPISRGGAFVESEGFGHEIYNFQPFEGHVYGYVQPRALKGEWERAIIRIERLGASAQDESLSGVLAVWVATFPRGGGRIVGWYDDATIYRQWQAPPPGAAREFQGQACGYFVTARAENALLLPTDARNFQIPQSGKGAFGQSNVWYADDPDLHRDLRQRVFTYVETRRLPSEYRNPARKQPDVLLRQRVEQAAIEVTAQHYRNLDFDVHSVEKDNVGWDLVAARARTHLRLEVKGLSGSDAVVELTPNEFKAMVQHRSSFRLCVVTSALQNPILHVFAFSKEQRRWVSDRGSYLRVQEIISARCVAVES